VPSKPLAPATVAPPAEKQSDSSGGPPRVVREW
jgi:hypothetical protein